MSEINFTKPSETKESKWTGLVFRPNTAICELSTDKGNIAKQELTAVQIDKYIRPLALEMLQADVNITEIALPTGTELITRAADAKLS